MPGSLVFVQPFLHAQHSMGDVGGAPLKACYWVAAGLRLGLYRGRPRNVVRSTSTPRRGRPPLVVVFKEKQTGGDPKLLHVSTILAGGCPLCCLFLRYLTPLPTIGVYIPVHHTVFPPYERRCSVYVGWLVCLVHTATNRCKSLPTNCSSNSYGHKYLKHKR